MLPDVLVTGSGRPAARRAAVPGSVSASAERSSAACGDERGPDDRGPGLTKRYGATLAVAGLSFTVRPGLVTRFLGPDRAGKTTAMRLILGLDRPIGAEATLGGRRYQDLGT